MMKVSPGVVKVSILVALLAVSLTACQGGSEGGDTGTVSDSDAGQGQVTEWEALTGEVMKLHNSGDYAEGVEVAKRALDVAQQNDGPDHPNVALSLGNLAELYEALEEYSEAEPLYQRSLEILEKEFGKNSPFLVPTLLNMASLYENTGREVEAQRVMERANDIQEGL